MVLGILNDEAERESFALSLMCSVQDGVATADISALGDLTGDAASTFRVGSLSVRIPDDATVQPVLFGLSTGTFFLVCNELQSNAKACALPTGVLRASIPVTRPEIESWPPANYAAYVDGTQRRIGLTRRNIVWSNPDPAYHGLAANTTLSESISFRFVQMDGEQMLTNECAVLVNLHLAGWTVA